MRTRTRSGSVFIVTIATMAGLVAILVSAAATQRVVFAAQANRMEARRAQLAAESGMQRAMAVFTGQSAQLTTLNDNWAKFGTNGDVKYTVGDTSFRIQIVDAAAKVNLNSASQAQLETLPITGEQIDCLLDWREGAVQPRPDGAKDQYYNGLTNPYNTALRNFETLDELLLVKSFTPATLYTVQQNMQGTSTLPNGPNNQPPILIDLLTVDSTSQALAPDGSPRLNASTVTAQQMIQRGIPAPLATNIFNGRKPYASMSQLLTTQGVNLQNIRTILDNLDYNGATSKTGKINLNTATEQVLDTVPGLPTGMGASIVAQQSTGFNSRGDMMTIPGMTLQLAQQTADMFEANSTTFLVRVLGSAGKTTYAIEAVVRLVNGAPRVIRVDKPAYSSDILTHWNWQADTTTETVLLGNQP